MRRFLPLLLLVLLVGCGGPTYKLEDRWSPLKEVVENPDLAKTGMTMTLGSTCRVWNLKEWLEDYQPGTVEYEALLMHEREHAVRQFAFPGGEYAWAALYGMDKDFRWQEEQVGWGKELTHLIHNGRMINAEAVAWILNRDYDGVTGHMVSFEDALKWTQATIAAAQQSVPLSRNLRRH